MVEDLDEEARRPRSSVFFSVSMSAWSTPSAKTVSRLCRAMPARSPPSWIALTRSGTVEPSPTPPSAASAAAFTAGSVLAAAATTAGKAARSRRAPEGPQQGTWAVGRQVGQSLGQFLDALAVDARERSPRPTGVSCGIALGQDPEDDAWRLDRRRPSAGLPARPAGRARRVGSRSSAMDLGRCRIALGDQALAPHLRQGVADLEPDLTAPAVSALPSSASIASGVADLAQCPGGGRGNVGMV